MKNTKIKTLTLLAAFSSALSFAGDISSINPPKGTLVNPMSYQTLGATIESKENGNKLALVCLEMQESGICSGYRYVEIPYLMNSQWKVLGSQNFALTKQVVTNPEHEANFLWNTDSYWLTADMASTISDAENGKQIVTHPVIWSETNAGMAKSDKESFVGFATGYGMMVGIGEASWAAAATVDAAHAVAFTVVDALHATVVYPFEALANAIRKGATRKNNKLLVEMGKSDEIGKNLKLRAKRYDRIRDAIDGQL